VNSALARVFVPWQAERILNLGPDLLVVDKPSGLTVHGGGVPGHDVVSRLSAYLGELRQPSYLGVHQRLDVGTSGVLCFVRDTALNAAVAADFENGRARKRYLAAVGLSERSPLLQKNELLLEHRLESQGDSVRVVRQGGKACRAECRVLERRAGRALVELRPITGRTHQLRVQLAAVGAPVAGDRLYDGPPAPRLLLHAARLELPGLERSFEAAPPAILARYLTGDEAALGPNLELGRRLRDAATLRAPLASTTEALRWVNGTGDELPGVVVDLYGEHACLAVESDEANARAEELAELLLEHGVAGVYLKRRVRKDLRHVDQEALAPGAPVAGTARAEPAVDEAGLRINVELGAGLSTGLFVDQRDNRQRIRGASSGCEVLNLFSYTCSFSVAAALGGARRVTSVDSSARALSRGVENFRLNGLDPERHAFVREDAVKFLERAARRGTRFDLVVLDPPSFSTRERAKVLSVARDYAELASRALAVLAPNGSLLAVTNHRKTRPAALRRVLVETAERLGRSVRRAKVLPAGLDCPDGPLGPEPSKSVWLTLG
jgi:23S rRNA (cytosine1962-C5)-methyltransferase